MKPKVLFICLGNSCRSIMAEALARACYGERIAVASAGIQPLGFITPETLTVLAEAGVATAGLYSKGLEESDLEGYTLLVNLSGYSLTSLLPPALHDRVLARPVVDPYGDDLDIYRQAREAIQRLITGELAALLPAN